MAGKRNRGRGRRPMRRRRNTRRFGDSPLPRTVRVPKDPPTVDHNRPQRYTIVLQMTGTSQITVTDVINVIKAQLRVTTANFIITQFKFWGADGFDAKRLKVTDAVTNRNYEDEASGGKRPVCGYSYPPTLQKIYSLASTDTSVLNFITGVEIVHCRLLLWV